MSEIINWLRGTGRYAVFGGVHKGDIKYIKFFPTQEEGEQGVFDYFSMHEANWRKGIEMAIAAGRPADNHTGWPRSLDLDASMTLEQIVNEDYFASMDEDEFYDTDFLYNDPADVRKHFYLLGYVYRDVTSTEDPKATTVDDWTWDGEDYEWAILVRLL